jgi:hypothetical protein
MDHAAKMHNGWRRQSIDLLVYKGLMVSVGLWIGPTNMCGGLKDAIQDAIHGPHRLAHWTKVDPIAVNWDPRRPTLD